MPVFAVTIFLSAFLLFQVQPLIAKYILPWFGGGAGVWTVCLLFFQTVLLAGYAYAHALTRWLRPRSQIFVHFVLLAAIVISLPIIPAEAWTSSRMTDPVLRIIGLLAATVGLPCLALSSTGPLLQYWFARVWPGRSPYRLYALSNAASLLALLSFPFYFESHFSRQSLAKGWGWGLAAFAAACALSALRFLKSAPQVGRAVPSAPGPRHDSANTPEVGRVVPSAPGPAHDSANAGLPDPRGGALGTARPTTAPERALQRLLWILLPACASVLLLAVTNKLCQDVAAVPFLWVVPLSIYLLSFVICFDHSRWYARGPFALLLALACAALCLAIARASSWSLGPQIAVYASTLFVCAMVCHGELYRLRPAAERLTGFYLAIAAGGALGGLFVAVVAPILFQEYFELQWAVLGTATLFLLICLADGSRLLPAAGDRPALAAWHWRLLGCALPLLTFGVIDWGIARLARQVPSVPAPLFIAVRAGLWSLLLLMTGSWLVRNRFREFRHWRALACAWLTLGWAVLAVALGLDLVCGDADVIYRSRNFYGVLTVYEHDRTSRENHHRLLLHGRITHGLQFVDPAQAMWPTTYYGGESGVGLAFDALPQTPRRIGLVGLGTGTLAVYGRPGDAFRVYEINPEIERLARKTFTYLSRSSAWTEVVVGDARLSLEREPDNHFDLLVLDAFSSDSIPVHLLTRESFQVYLRHLNPDGILAVHISNHFLDLEPVVAGLARQFKLTKEKVDSAESSEEWWHYGSTWMLLSRNPAMLNSEELRAAAAPATTNAVSVLWTDDFASLFQILK